MIYSTLGFNWGMEFSPIKRQTKIVSISFLFFLFSFLFFPLSARGARIAITPLVFELKGERGGIVEEYVRVMNPSYEEKITVIMESEDIFPEGEEGRVKLEVPPAERVPFSLSSWISFEPAKLTLEPREEKEVKFIIKIPEIAEPGGHYAAVLAKTETTSGPTGVGVGIVQRVASLVLLTVGGQTREEIRVVDFKTSKNYYEYGPVQFIIRLENTGTVHLKPQTKITVYNLFNKKIGEIEVEPHNVLPSSVRKFEANLSQKWFFAGKYKAVLSGFYGKTNIPLEPVTITFFAFSWKIGVLFIVLLIFLILTRKRWSKAIKILIQGEKALKEITQK